MRSFSILLLALLLMAVPAVTTATPDTVATVSADREYPNGWTHRPLVELFTSLSCVFCMSYADPAMDEVLHDIEGDSSVPYHIVYFHQPNGGAGDDPFHTEDSNARMRDHYGQTGTPNAQFDGNYRYEGGGSESNYDDYKAELEDSGPRDGDDGEDFKIVDLDIYSEFIGSSTEGEVGTFKVRVDMTYHGLAGPESWEQQAGLEDTNLDGTLYVFMVEDDVTAWSSYLEQDWVNMRVFRGYAIEGEEFTLQKDEAATYEAVWKVPTTQVDADGVEGPIKIPINPGRITPIAAVFDRDDTESGGKNDDPSDDTYPTPRSIQSASPQSTIYDNPERDVPEIDRQRELFTEAGAQLEVEFEAEEGIGTSFAVYNYDSQDYTGEWQVAELKIEGEEVCDDDGVCYAYADATGTATLPYQSDDNIYYQVLYVDGNGTSGRSDVQMFVGSDGGGRPVVTDGALPWLLISGAATGGLLGGTLFVVWARRPA
ncbi:MAG TPA: hypothetical protein QF608_01780 [Candidatus Poseidoniia archaeon]|jgi:hypothetical protein|nr:hypothetical protein [Candidatus Poseidoniia archaeon]